MNTTSPDNGALERSLLQNNYLYLPLHYLVGGATVKFTLHDKWGCIYNKWGDHSPPLWLVNYPHDHLTSQWTFEKLKDNLVHLGIHHQYINRFIIIKMIVSKAIILIRRIYCISLMTDITRFIIIQEWGTIIFTQSQYSKNLAFG